MKQYAVYVAVVDENGRVVIRRTIEDYNDLYSLPEANRIINKLIDTLHEAIENDTH